MDHSSSCSSGKHAEPAFARAVDLGRAPAELLKLLGDAMPHVQAALKRLLDIAAGGGTHVTQQQLWHAQELLAGVQTCSFGRGDSLGLVRKASQIMQQVVLLGDLMAMPEIARRAAAKHLLEPPSARAALLRLLTAVVRWEPGVQLPAASYQQQQQPSVDAGAGCSGGGREGQQGEEEAEQVQGANGGLVEKEEGLVLSGLRNNTCVLVFKLLDSARKSLKPTYDVDRAQLSLDFGCSLLQARVLQCLSRQLAAVSAGLVGQLPPCEPTEPDVPQGQQQQTEEQGVRQQQQQHGGGTTEPNVPQGQQQQAEEQSVRQQQQQYGGGTTEPNVQQGQRQQNEEVTQTAPAPPFAGLQSSAQTHRPTVATSGAAGLGGTHVARSTRGMARVLLSGLHGLIDMAVDVYRWAAAAGNTGPQHSSRPLRQQPHAEDDRKELRQLSRRYLLLLAGGLRDSHVLDHWARVVLLAGLCRGAGEQGGAAEGGRREEEEGTGEVVSRAAGEGLLSQLASEHHQQQQRQTQWPGERGSWLHLCTAPDVQCVWTCLAAIGRVHENCKNARRSGGDDPLRSLPPGLDAALQQALSSPCTQHLTLALGTLMLHQADGGSLYGMPLPYSTGPLAAAVGKADRRRSASQQGLALLDQDLYMHLSYLLSRLTDGVPQPLPVVPPEGHLDLLLRLGQLAVRSAQALRGQEGRAGPQLVIGSGCAGGVAMTALWEARTLLSSRGQGALAGAGGSVGTVEGPSGGLGGAAGSGAVEGPAGRGGREEGNGGGTAGGKGQAGTGQLGTAEAVGQPGPSAAARRAARRAARAALAAETRWHRLLLDTGLWVEMEVEQLEEWVKHWSTVCKQQGRVPKDAAHMPADAPAPVAGALAAGVLPCLERVLRRAGERDASGGSAAGDPPLLSALFSRHLDWWPWLGWLLAYGDVRQGAAFMVTLRKLMRRQKLTIVARQLEAATSGGSHEPARLNPTAAAYTKAYHLLFSAVEVGRGLGSNGDSGGGGGCCGGGGCADTDRIARQGASAGSGGGGDGVGGTAGGGGSGSSGSSSDAHGSAVVGCANGGTSSAQPHGVRGSGVDSPGLPRLQLLLWYGVRQLMPPLLDMAAAWGPRSPLLRYREASPGLGLHTWATLLPAVATLSLQVAGEGPGEAGAWLSSWRRVLLEEWRVVELVGSALKQLVPALGAEFRAAGASATVWSMCAEGLAAASCAVTLAFSEQVWSAAGGSGAGGSRTEVRQSTGGGSGSSSSSSSSRRQGRKGASSASARSVWVWPTKRVHELRDLLMRAGGDKPEVGALVALAQMESAGGPSAPLVTKGAYAYRTLELKAKSELVGGYRWWGGEVPSPELLDGLLRTCSYPRCASLEGDSEAGAEGRLAACGRGCGGAWYCSRECEEAHCREGHAEACGGGAAA